MHTFNSMTVALAFSEKAAVHLLPKIVRKDLKNFIQSSVDAAKKDLTVTEIAKLVINHLNQLDTFVDLGFSKLAIAVTSRQEACLKARPGQDRRKKTCKKRQSKFLMLMK